MTLQELKDKIRDLGFDDDTTMSEYADIVANAITRACKTIALTVKAPLGRLDMDFNVLGKTESDVYEGSTENPIVVDGVSIQANKFDVVSAGEKDYYFDGTAWQKMGKYDLEELTTDSDGNIGYDGIDRIVVDSDAGVDTFSDWEIVQDRILVISSSYTTPLTVFYRERIIPITSTTDDDYKIQVLYQCEPLVGLLAAHYVWLDDDERKAILYWNEYDQLKQEIMANSFKTRAKVIGGIRWRN